MQQPGTGVECLMDIVELVEGDIALTDMQRVYAPEIADQAIAYLLAFTRTLTLSRKARPSRSLKVGR